MFESIWHVLVNVTVCWGYIQKPQVRQKLTTCMFNHGLIVLLWCMEWTWDKEYNTDYLYKLLTTFRFVHGVVYDLLAMMEESTNTIGIT